MTSWNLHQQWLTTRIFYLRPSCWRIVIVWRTVAEHTIIITVGRHKLLLFCSFLLVWLSRSTWAEVASSRSWGGPSWPSKTRPLRWRSWRTPAREKASRQQQQRCRRQLSAFSSASRFFQRPPKTATKIQPILVIAIVECRLLRDFNWPSHNIETLYKTTDLVITCL